MKIPYPLVAAVDTHKRHSYMALALQHNYPRLKQRSMDDRRTMTIACYGPSLAQTWQTMTRPILSMSGATRFLAERGVIPDYHCDMDPRAHKIDFIKPPVEGVHYLMASVCHPDTWAALRGQRITLWHLYSADTTYEVVASIDNGEIVVRGGSTIGLTALHLAGVMGYRHFEIHGMDGSFVDIGRSARHAGSHPGTKQNKDGITWKVFGKTYATSKIMANAVSETMNALEGFPIFCVFHGEGLTQALVRKRNYANACCADEVEKAARIRTATAHVLDKLLVDPKKGITPIVAAWDVLCGHDFRDNKDIRVKMEEIAKTNETRRTKADYNTGSISINAMMQLRAICTRYKPRIIAEIGTFIGNSTMAMQSASVDQIFTCDRSNDCFPLNGVFRTFPKQDSTEMFRQMLAKNLKVDLFFFDGRIVLSDLPLILRLSHRHTIYLFDDFRINEKGAINSQFLLKILPAGWMPIEPDYRIKDSTLVALAPMKWFIHGEKPEIPLELHLPVEGDFAAVLNP